MRPSAATKKAHQFKRRAILVLGMHRSGTSALSGVVCALGASAPNNLLPANFANPTGYWESLPLVQADNELLASAHSSWDDWRQLDPQWYESGEARDFRDRLRDIVKSEYDDKPLFVVKDPRLCRFVPFFVSVLEELTIAPVALFSIRDPLEVAFSLRRRDGIPVSKSIALWLRHVLEAELHSRQMPRCFISYENLLKDWRSEMTRASEMTGVTWPADPEISARSIEKFLAADLYHERSALAGWEKHPDLLYLAGETHDLLRRASTAGTDRNLLRRIDAVRKKFDQASDFFGAILLSEEISVRQLRARQKKQHRALEEERNKHAQELMAERNEHRQALAEERKKHQQEFDRQLRRNEKEREEYVARLDALGGQLAELRDTSGKNESRLNVMVKELRAALDREKTEHERVLTDLESSRNALDDVQQALAENLELSQRLAGELRDIDARHRALQAEVLRKDASIENLNRNISAHKAQVEKLCALLADRGYQNQVMMAQMDALYASRSWRMTRPLRAARRFFSKAASARSD